MLIVRQYLDLPRAVHILCMGTFINRAGTFLVVFLTLYVKDNLGLGVRFATACMGAFGLGSILAALVGGHLADAIGRRVVMLSSMFGGAALLALFSFLNSAWSIMACILMIAFVAEMYRPAASAMVADLVEPTNRPHAYGLLYVSVNLGFSIAPIVGGEFIEQFSFKLLFWCDAATMACYGLIVLLFIRETRPASPKRTARVAPDAAPGESAAVAEMRWPQALRRIVSDGPFVVFCVGTFFLAMTFMQAMSTFPLYLEQHGFGAKVYGRILSLNGIMIVCLQLPLTSFISRFNRAWLMVLAAMLTGAGFALIGVVHTAWLFALTVVVWTAGEMIGAPLSPTIVSDLAPERMRARYMGVFGVSFSGANMVGAPLGGLVLEYFGGQVLWTATLVVSTISALLFLSIYRHVTPASAAIAPAAARLE